MDDEPLYPKREESLEERMASRVEKRAQLERLLGFPQLTRQQQDIIVASNSMQIFAQTDRSEKFDRARKFVTTWWCHKTIHNLEQERAIDVRSRDIPADFFDATYEEDSIYGHISRVKEFGYPCVVLMSYKPGDYWLPLHTALVFGGEKGEPRIWHKDGDSPFESAVALQDVIYSYASWSKERGAAMRVGIRKLKCLKSDEHMNGVIEPVKSSG